MIRKRVLQLALGVGLSALAIGVGLYRLHVVRASDLRARALDQQRTTVEVGGGRGMILDRTGRELAVSAETWSLYAHPHRVVSDAARERAARLLAPVLQLSENVLRRRLASDRPFVWLKRRLDPRTVRCIRELGLPLGGDRPFGFKAEPRRFYPLGRLGVHIVGYANIDQTGVEGIERQFDRTLRGDPSTFLAMRDGDGRLLLQEIRHARKQPEDIVLALDLGLQHIVERELDRALEETGCLAASAVMIDPTNGQILALANRPAADPNEYGGSASAARRNRAVVDIYEPGSTFKIVAAAAVLERGTVDPGQQFDCGQGGTLVAGQRIRDYRPFGRLTFREILEKSSNVGMIKICSTLSPELFHDYIVRFGFGERLGLELPGERDGLLRPLRRWSSRSQASISFGQEIGVTVVQMAAAFSVLANDGVLLSPRVALGRRDAQGKFHRFPPPEPRRVITVRTARKLAGMLEGVVERGTGARAAVPGYRIAGKTGTAQKAAPGGGYSATDHVASIGGFGPLPRPRVALMVVLDTPRVDRDDGGYTAGPVFGRIMTRALVHLRVRPRDDPRVPMDQRASHLHEEQREAATARRRARS